MSILNRFLITFTLLLICSVAFAQKNAVNGGSGNSGGIIKIDQIDESYVIVEFSVAIMPKGMDYIAGMVCKNANGATFSDNPEVVRQMSRVKSGDRVFITGIKAVDSEGKARKVNSIELSLN